MNTRLVWDVANGDESILIDHQSLFENPEALLMFPRRSASDMLSIQGTILQVLDERGWQLGGKVNEGCTRDVWSAYKTGNPPYHEDRAMLKIPKKEANELSVCTMINRSKKDLEEQERNILTSLEHPNIIKIRDFFQARDGRKLVIEEDAQGLDLEKIIEQGGPIRDDISINQIFGQFLDAINYLNIERRVLHRDLKPANVLIGGNVRLKLTDFQNSARISDVRELLMPTRGGTQHTYIDLLNSLVGGKLSKATQRTEVYSFGSTMYHALTGQDAFRYRIVKDDSGKEIKIWLGKPGDEEKIAGDLFTTNEDLKRFYKTIGVSLKDDERTLDSITPEYHEARLEEALKRAPGKYQEFLRRCMTSCPKGCFSDASEARDYFREMMGMVPNQYKFETVRNPTSGQLAEAVPVSKAPLNSVILTYMILSNAEKK